MELARAGPQETAKVRRIVVSGGKRGEQAREGGAGAGAGVGVGRVRNERNRRRQ